MVVTLTGTQRGYAVEIRKTHDSVGYPVAGKYFVCKSDTASIDACYKRASLYASSLKRTIAKRGLRWALQHSI